MYRKANATRINTLWLNNIMVIYIYITSTSRSANITDVADDAIIILE
jgi:hypothetical protein